MNAEQRKEYLRSLIFPNYLFSCPQGLRPVRINSFDAGQLLQVRSFHCAECGQVADQVEIVLRRPTACEKARQAPSTYRLWVAEFSFGGCGGYPIDDIGAVCAALAAGDAKALYSMSDRYAPFYCRECDACYCMEHWNVLPSISECVSGHCPRGHRHLLDY